jgi:hypothetical protein
VGAIVGCGACPWPHALSNKQTSKHPIQNGALFFIFLLCFPDRALSFSE